MKRLVGQLKSGITARAVLDLTADTERFTQDEFYSHCGKPIRELAAVACLGFAILKDSANQALVRLCQSDPPDVEVEMMGRLESLEVVTLVADGARPHADAKKIERAWKAVGEAPSVAAQEEIIQRDLMGALEIETSDEDRERTREQWERMGTSALVNSPETRRAERLQVLEIARQQLLAKAKKYAGKGTSFGLLIHSLVGSRLPQTDPEIWTDWLSAEQRQAAAIFPDIYFVKSNSIVHEVLILRKTGNWIEPPGYHSYKDPIAEERFRLEAEDFDQRVASNLQNFG